MKVIEIAFTTYPVTDIDRARGFYEGLLGLKPTMDSGAGGEGHWVEYDIGPGTLGIGKHPDFKPSGDGCMAGLEVDDFENAVSELKSAGVTFTMEPLETPVCHLAIVGDPDGNSVLIHKRKAA